MLAALLSRISFEFVICRRSFSTDAYPSKLSADCYFLKYIFDLVYFAGTALSLKELRQFYTRSSLD